MELRQIEHFVAVVEEQNFTRAARRCNVSQSALSASVKSLERDLDVPLLTRTTRHVELTDAGRALLDQARGVLAAAAAARDAVSATQGQLGGSLGVGGMPTSGFLDQAALLARFHAQHPQVEIRYIAAMSVDLIESVRTGRLDLAFVSVPPKTPRGVDIEALASYPMHVVCRSDHPLASRRVVDPDMLGDETFVGGPHRSVANDAISNVRRAAEKKRRAPGASTRLTVNANDLQSMLDFIASGLGVALLPSAVTEGRPRLVAVPLSDPAMVWTVGVVAAPHDRRTRAALALLDLLHESRGTTGAD